MNELRIDVIRKSFKNKISIEIIEKESTHTDATPQIFDLFTDKTFSKHFHWLCWRRLCRLDNESRLTICMSKEYI